jgi:hypothetical protein
MEAHHVAHRARRDRSRVGSIAGYRAGGRIDVRIPDPSETQVLATRDGLRVYGRVEDIGEASIQFRTIAGD